MIDYIAVPAFLLYYCRYLSSDLSIRHQNVDLSPLFRCISNAPILSVDIL